MKRILYFLTMFCGLAAATSCFDDPVSLDGTVWDVVYYEDLFDGSVVGGDNLNGTLKAYKEGDGVVLYMTVDEFGYTNDAVEPDAYRIVRNTGSELIIDLWYYEYDDVRVGDCTYEETYKGKKIYSFPDPENSNYSYYVYFNPRGKAVDLGVEYTGATEYYYYDTTRIKCEKR
ncbi:MAG: hypothetical protein J5640_00515 [Bacteroidales bacterium]|nr:hypothetical protein [Bacteroidales bacterium]